METLIKRLNLRNVFVLLALPTFGFLAATQTPLRKPTAVWTMVYYLCTGLGITAGYHRLWSHRSYSASLALQICLALFGCGAAQGSIRWWVRAHRAHHRYTDTDRDPYNVHKGLLYAHLGWMILKQDPKNYARVQISDLDSDPIIIWQHRYHLEILLVMGFILPGLVAGVGWNDWSGGLVYSGILRIFFMQQATFCVNSLAHWLGEQPFDDYKSPRDHLLTAIITLGEGYHNFHHTFPSDYRNAIHWFQYDPTKWAIWIWWRMGLASNLREFCNDEIEKSLLQQTGRRLAKEQTALERQVGRLDWGTPVDQLPKMTWEEFQVLVSQERKVVVIAGFIYDVGSFVKQHPGGAVLLESSVGCDATAMFNGGVYKHSSVAHNILATMRVAILLGGMEIVKMPHMRDKEICGQ